MCQKSGSRKGCAIQAMIVFFSTMKAYCSVVQCDGSYKMSVCIATHCSSTQSDEAILRAISSKKPIEARFQKTHCAAESAAPGGLEQRCSRRSSSALHRSWSDLPECAPTARQTSAFARGAQNAWVVALAREALTTARNANVISSRTSVEVRCE